MSNIVKADHNKIVLSIGNVDIVDSQPDEGLVQLGKVSVLAVSALATASVSPMIAIALGGYAAFKIFDLCKSLSDSSPMNSLVKDVLRDEVTTPAPTAYLAGSIGMTTRLGAIDVPVRQVPQQQSTDSPVPVEIPESIPVTPAAQRQPSPQRQRETALDALLASPYISRALFGAQRTGKSYLAAVASRKLSEQGTKTYHLNLASFGTEDDEYWSHATKSVRGDLPSVSDPDEAVGLIEDAIAAVEEWFTQPDSILIVDELAYLGSSSNAYSELLKPLLKIIADKIACLSSTGIKRQQAIWTIAPEFVAGGLTQDARAVKKLQLCYVSIAPNRSVDWNGSRIGFNGELFEQIKNNFPIEYPPAMGLSSDRICFVNNKWLSVGELPKLGNTTPTPQPKSQPSQMALKIKSELGGGEPKK